MELYPLQIDSGNGNGRRTNTRTGKNVAVGIRSLLRKCAFGAMMKIKRFPCLFGRICPPLSVIWGPAREVNVAPGEGGFSGGIGIRYDFPLPTNCFFHHGKESVSD